MRKEQADSKIIITPSFKKDATLVINNFLQEEFVRAFKSKIHKLIEKHPFVKLKFNINNISLRVVAYRLENNIVLLVPIYIKKKTNKKDWDNIRLTKKFISSLEVPLSKSLQDIENENYDVL